MRHQTHKSIIKTALESSGICKKYATAYKRETVAPTAHKMRTSSGFWLKPPALCTHIAQPQPTSLVCTQSGMQNEDMKS